MATFKIGPKKPQKGVDPVIVDGPYIRIGRNMNLDVVLEDMLSAYEHARIEHLGTAFVIEDAGSHSGTYVNGASVQGRVPLQKGAKVVIGATVFEVKDCDPANGKIELTKEELAPPKPGKTEKTKEEAGEGASLIQKRGAERVFTWPKLFSCGGCLGFIGIAGTLAFAATMNTSGLQAAFMNGPLSREHAEGDYEGRKLVCGDCHSIGAGVKNETCGNCHLTGKVGKGTTKKQNVQRPHAWPYPDPTPDDPDAARRKLLISHGQCDSCHQEHQGADAQIAPDHLPADKCKGCHEKFHEKYKGEAAKVAISFDRFPHDKHLASKEQDIKCGLCHRLPEPPKEGEGAAGGEGGPAPAAVDTAKKDDFPAVGYEQCIGCHHHEGDKVENHGLASVDRVCVKCHQKKADGGGVSADLLAAKDTRARVASLTFKSQQHKQFFDPNLCGRCHVDDGALDLPSKVNKKKFIHAPHLTATKPGEGKAAIANLEAQCVECHGSIAGATDVAASKAIIEGAGGTFSTCTKLCHNGGEPVVEMTPPKEVTTSAFAHADHLKDMKDEATRARFAKTEAGKKILEQRCFACHAIETTQGPGGAVETIAIKDQAADCKTCHTKKHEHGEVSKCTGCHAVETDALFNPTSPVYRDKKPSFYSHKSKGSDRSKSGAVKSHIQMVEGGECAECHADVAKAAAIHEITYPALGGGKCETCHPGGEVEWDCYANCHKYHEDPMLERVATIEMSRGSDK